jgi:2-iminobutanoate/2-iminopropanoate deaminase
LFAEMRILLYGTKNAYTTLRSGDAVFYKLETPIEDKDTAIGLFTKEGTIVPLYCADVDKCIFRIESTTTPLNALELNKDRRILRIVSSDRKGDDIVIEEYIDESYVYVPIREQGDELAPANTIPAAPATTTTTTTTTTTATADTASSIPPPLSRMDISATNSPSTLDMDIEILKMKIQLLEFQKQKLSFQSDPLQAVCTGNAPLPVGPYSQAVIHSLSSGHSASNMVYISGCIALDPTTNQLVAGDTAEQMRQVLTNFAAVLRASGSNRSKVLKTTLFLASMQDYAVVNELYKEFFAANKVFPARSTIAVAQLPLGAKVELEAIAVA